MVRIRLLQIFPRRLDDDDLQRLRLDSLHHKAHQTYAALEQWSILHRVESNL